MKSRMSSGFVLVLAVATIALVSIGNVNTEVQGSVAVQVPEIVKLALDALFTALLTAGTVWVFEHFKLDLRGFAVPIAMAISAFTVTELQDIINIIPEIYDATLNIMFQIIAVLLGAIGLFRLRQPPATNQLI